MKAIILSIHAFVLVSVVYTQRLKNFQGLELYHKFYELPNGDLKFFYCEIGKLKDVRVQYKSRVVTDKCNDYDRQRNQLWKECTVTLTDVEREKERIVSHRMTSSGSLKVSLNGVDHYTICGSKLNATQCLVTIFGSS